MLLLEAPEKTTKSLPCQDSGEFLINVIIITLLQCISAILLSMLFTLKDKKPSDTVANKNDRNDAYALYYTKDIVNMPLLTNKMSFSLFLRVYIYIETDMRLIYFYVLRNTICDLCLIIH